MEFSQDEVLELISLARAMKKNPADYGSWLKGKSVVTLFEKPSLRTRVTFDIGITRLGGHCIYMDQQNGAIGKRELSGTMPRIFHAGATALSQECSITALSRGLPNTLPFR